MLNVKKLKLAEANFLHMYPDGFADPEMESIGKKHRVDKMTEFATEIFAKARFNKPEAFLENLIKLVSRSSMVSMFEKPRFRDAVNSLVAEDRKQLVAGYRKMLYGNQQAGFEQVVDVLVAAKVAKWSLLTIGPVYFRPQREVFVKPTTAKKIVERLELTQLTYKPRPSWEFYEGYREALLEMKAQVNPSLAPNNAAFTGFLMMAL